MGNFDPVIYVYTAPALAWYAQATPFDCATSSQAGRVRHLGLSFQSTLCTEVSQGRDAKAIAVDELVHQLDEQTARDWKCRRTMDPATTILTGDRTVYKDIGEKEASNKKKIQK